MDSIMITVDYKKVLLNSYSVHEQDHANLLGKKKSQSIAIVYTGCGYKYGRLTNTHYRPIIFAYKIPITLTDFLNYAKKCKSDPENTLGIIDLTTDKINQLVQNK